jgi:nucleoside-diphosphate-sugar epimerase
MKICVTGVTGFVGSAVCHRALSEGYSVVGTCRTCSNVQPLSGVSFFESGDINANTDWSSALKGTDVVVHTIARAHIKLDANTDSLEAYRRINLHGTVNLARQAAESGVKRFIFLSSIKVNGEASPFAYTESDKPKPTDSYGLSKLEAEKALGQVSSETGMAIITLRPPLVYGPNVKANFLKLLRFVDRGIPLPLASVNNQRSLIYVGNLVDAIVRCIRCEHTAAKTYLIRDSFNVSTPELIRMMATSLGRPARLFKVPPKFLDAISWLLSKEMELERLTGSLTVDDTKIRRELGWKPPFTTEYGLKKTIEWYKKVHCS